MEPARLFASSYTERMASHTLAGIVALGLGVGALVATASPSTTRTKVTVWSAPGPAASVYGGLAYGGTAPTSGALITEQREIEVVAGAEIQVPGVAATVDPASVQLRDRTEPGASISEQRFVRGATTPTEILQRHVGDPVTIVTAKGEVSGVLRSADEATLVLEVGTGDQRRLQVLRREYVHDVRLPAGAGLDRPSLVWRLAAKKPGKHDIELAYRAEGMTWSADYLAVLAENAATVDFSAWATVKNASGATFDNAELTLVSSGSGGSAARGSALPAPTRYVVPTPVHLGSGQTVQVEIFPTKQNAKARSVVAYEAMPDPSLGFQAYPNTDCNQFNGVGMGNGRAESAIEIDVPSTIALPDGRARVFRRRADRLEVVSEEPLRTSTGLARMRIAPSSDIAGERKALACTFDERAHSITEKIELRVENKGKREAQIVVREFAWRWPIWRLEAEDAKSTRSGAQTLEYRVMLPPGGKKTITYSLLYTW